MSKKGFLRIEGGNHEKYWFLTTEGRKTEIYTALSRRSRSTDLSAEISSRLARQLRLSKDQFGPFVECSINQAEYRKILHANGVVT